MIAKIAVAIIPAAYRKFYDQIQRETNTAAAVPIPLSRTAPSYPGAPVDDDHVETS